MEGQIPPVFYRTLSPSGPLPYLLRRLTHGNGKAGQRYCWPHLAFGRLVVFIMEGEEKRIQTIIRRLDYNFSHLVFKWKWSRIYGGGQGVPHRITNTGQKWQKQKVKAQGGNVRISCFSKWIKEGKKARLGFMVYQNEHQQGAEGLPIRSTIRRKINLLFIAVLLLCNNQSC